MLPSLLPKAKRCYLKLFPRRPPAYSDWETERRRKFREKKKTKKLKGKVQIKVKGKTIFSESSTHPQVQRKSVRRSQKVKRNVRERK